MEERFAEALKAFIAVTQEQLNDVVQSVAVDTLAIRALLMTHPDPSAFARAFEDLYEGREGLGGGISDRAKALCDRRAADLVGFAKQLAAQRSSGPGPGPTP